MRGPHLVIRKALVVIVWSLSSRFPHLPISTLLQMRLVAIGGDAVVLSTGLSLFLPHSFARFEY